MPSGASETRTCTGKDLGTVVCVSVLRLRAKCELQQYLDVEGYNELELAEIRQLSADPRDPLLPLPCILSARANSIRFRYISRIINEFCARGAAGPHWKRKACVLFCAVDSARCTARQAGGPCRTGMHTSDSLSHPESSARPLLLKHQENAAAELASPTVHSALKQALLVDSQADYKRGNYEAALDKFTHVYACNPEHAYESADLFVN
eukprot:6183469-Pleurochrysis_carterae.AAC.1